MSRWTEVDALKANINTAFWSEIEKIIDSAPSIDLVRCGECKFKRLYDNETKYFYCALEDRPNRHWSVDDWNFCYWGERKESE